jgi:hypothetical protein
MGVNSFPEAAQAPTGMCHPENGLGLTIQRGPSDQIEGFG